MFFFSIPTPASKHMLSLAPSFSLGFMINFSFFRVPGVPRPLGFLWCCHAYHGIPSLSLTSSFPFKEVPPPSLSLSPPPSPLPPLPLPFFVPPCPALKTVLPGY
eukprot:RCo021640